MIGSMTDRDVPSGGVRAWLARHSAAILLIVTASGLFAGLVLLLAGARGAGNAAWALAGVIGSGYSLWAMADAFRHRRVGVDIIALLALVGALSVGELLAAAVISVMLASGRALEEWAGGGGGAGRRGAGGAGGPPPPPPPRARAAGRAGGAAAGRGSRRRRGPGRPGRWSGRSANRSAAGW